MKLGFGLGFGSGLGGGDVPVPPAFTSPDDISDLEVWLDGDDVTANGSNQIGSWNDKSGNGNHATQGTDGDKPLTGNTRNGNDVTTWDGSDDLFFGNTGNTIGALDLYAHPSAGSWTVFSSFMATADSGNVLAKAPSTPATRTFALAYGSGVVSCYIRGTNTNLGAAAHGDWVTVVIEYDHILNLAFYRFNGGSRTPLPIGTGTNASTPTRVGARTDGESFPFTGQMGNILGYTKILATPEMDFMQTYQANRWDVPIDNTITLPAASFGDTADDVPVRIVKDDFYPNKDWDGAGHIKLADNSIPKQKTSTTPIIQNDAIWTWFNRPEAVYANGYTFIGWFSFNEDDWYVGRYEHATKKWIAKNLGNDGSAQQDDHNNPTIVIDDDGTVHVFASEHNTTATRHFISDAPYDISSFTSNTLTSFGATATYPQAQIMDGGVIALTWREIVTSPYRPRRIAFYDIGMATWGTEKTLVDIADERPYMHILVDPNDDDKLHVIYTVAHPREITQGTNDIFHGFYRLSTDSIYETDGTLIGTLSVTAFDETNGTLIEDASTRGYNFWGSDISIAADGNPAVVYSEHNGQEEIYYRYAKWNGSAWVPHDIVFAGQSIYGVFDSNPEPQYIPGLAIADDGVTVFYARDADQGKLQVFKAVTTDAGENWTEALISPIGGGEKIRPVAVRGGQSDLQALYLTGNFTDFEDAHLDMAVYPSTAAQSWIIDSYIEVDTDGSDIDLEFVTTAATLDRDFTDEIVFVDSEMAIRKLTGTEDVISGRTNFTVVVAGMCSSISSTLNHNTVLSDYTDTEDERSMIMRINNSSDGVDFYVQSESAGLKSIVGVSDAVIADGVDFGIAGKLDAGTLKIASNGVISATTATSVGDVKTKTGGEDFRAGVSPHNPALWAGEIYAVGFYDTAKPDDWMKMASKGLQGWTW
jgi:hypothetical protein